MGHMVAKGLVCLTLDQVVPSRGHCVVSLDETLKSHCASLHPGVFKQVLVNQMLGGNPFIGQASHPGGGK